MMVVVNLAVFAALVLLLTRLHGTRCRCRSASSRAS
jgi:hypothetical protein